MAEEISPLEDHGLSAVNQELLEALQAMLRMTERHAPPGLSPTPGSPIALARAAIARAVEEKLRAKNSTLACIPAVPPG